MQGIRARVPGVAAVLLLCLLSSVAAEAGAYQALWVWSGKLGNFVGDPQARQTLMANASASGVNALYVSVYQSTASSTQRQMYEDKDIADLISQAHSKKMTA